MEFVAGNDVQVGKGYVAVFGCGVCYENTVWIVVELLAALVLNESCRVDGNVISIYPRVTLDANTSDDTLCAVSIANRTLGDNPVLCGSLWDYADVLSGVRGEQALSD